MTEIHKLIAELKMWMVQNDDIADPDEYMHEFDTRFLEIEKHLFKAFENEEISEEDYVSRTGFLDSIYDDVKKKAENKQQIPPEIRDLLKRFGGREGFFIMGGFK